MAETESRSRRRPILSAALILMSLAMGCSGLTSSAPGTVSRGQWKASYLSARAALEAGRSAEAAEAYARIVEKSGPVGPRVRLEYAHALLRANDFAAAAEQARRSAARQDGLGRSAALAVEAVADHEQVRSQLTAGRADRELAARLTAAAATLDEVLAAGGDLDPEGRLAARRAEIATEAAVLDARLGI